MELRNLLPSLTITGLPLGAKRLYFACVHSVILYGKAIWTVKVENVTRLQRNDKQMVR